MGLNIIKDWKNYKFTLDCFKMLVDDIPMREFYKLKYKRGVMFTAIFIDNELPEKYRDQAILNKLAILDEAMAVMNMSGLFRVKFELVTAVPDENYRVWYRVLFIPTIHWTTKLFTVLYPAIIAAGIYWFTHR